MNAPQEEFACCYACDHFAAHPRFPKWGLCLNPSSPHYHARSSMFKKPLHVGASDLCAHFARAPAPESIQGARHGR